MCASVCWVRACLRLCLRLRACTRCRMGLHACTKLYRNYFLFSPHIFLHLNACVVNKSGTLSRIEFECESTPSLVVGSLDMFAFKFTTARLENVFASQSTARMKMFDTSRAFSPSGSEFAHCFPPSRKPKAMAETMFLEILLDVL